MPNCRFCGKWSGLFSNEHLDCARADKAGKPLPDAAPVYRAESHVTVKDIALGVFSGLWFFTASAALVGLILRIIYGALASPTP